MKLYLKPVIAATLLSLVTTPALAYKDKKSKGAPTDSARVSASMDELMNPMAPKRDAYFSIKDKISFNFDLTVAAQYATTFEDDNFGAMDIRAASIYSDLNLGHDINLHSMINTGNSLAFNAMNPDSTFESTFYIDEFYLTYHNKTNPNTYAKFGRGYYSFGTYSDPYKVVYSLNQTFVQAQGTYLELGTRFKNGLSAQLFQYQTNSDFSNTSAAYDNNNVAGISPGWNNQGLVLGYDSKAFGRSLKTKLSYISKVSSFNGRVAEFSYVNLNMPTAAYNLDVSSEADNSKINFSYYATNGTAFNYDSANGRPEVISLGLKQRLMSGSKPVDFYVSAEKTLHAAAISSGFGVELNSDSGDKLNARLLGPEFSDAATRSEGAVNGDIKGVPEYLLSLGLEQKLSERVKFGLDYTFMRAYDHQVKNSSYGGSYSRKDQNQITASVKYEL